MDKGNVNKHNSRNIPVEDGSKSPFSSAARGAKTASDYSRPKSIRGVEETSKWGWATAAERYGKPQSPNMKPKDQSQPEFRDEQASDKNFNKVRSDWRIGANEDATTMPNFKRTRY